VKQAKASLQIMKINRGSSVGVFSDLDGTLLDHDTYGYEPARPALDLIRCKKIPLILCSSKTRAEMAGIRGQLGLEDPFITENGGAIYIPYKTLLIKDIPFRGEGEFQVIELGLPYEQLVTSLQEIREETGLPLLGFSDLSVDQVGERSGLERSAAALAKKREYSEPFLLEEEIPSLELLKRAIRRRKLTLAKGGRFFHLMGDNDKGKAVRLITSLYRERNPGWKTIGLGDSPNDFPMLENVDFPVLVRKKDGTHEPWKGLKGVFVTSGTGPEGWNEALLTFLQKEEPYE
jgi:mannosyl-3-phosphoglycerate phosphatase